MKILGFDISRAEKRVQTTVIPEAFWSPADTEDVNAKKVNGIAAWWRGKQIYSNTVAGLPKNLYEMVDGERRIVESHPSLNLIKMNANEYLDSYSWHDYMVGAVIDYGNAYSVIIRDQYANPVALKIVHPNRVDLKVYEDGQVLYMIKGSEDEKPMDVLYEDMYHIKGLNHNGYWGVNPLEAHKINLGAVLSAQKYNKNFYDNGTNLQGYISMPGKLTPEMIEKVRKSWQAKYSGAGGSTTAFLDQDMKYNSIGMRPEDAQYLQTRKFQTNEIATILGLPSHMVNDMDKATYNNMEQANTQFVTHSLLPYVQKFEVENNKLLKESEKGRLKWKYNVNGLMRGDSTARSEYYAKMLKIGAMTPNQVRTLEDMNAYEGGDRYYIEGNNLVPVDKIDEYNMQGGNNEQ